MKAALSTIESFLLKTINVDRYLPLQLDITNACNLRCVHCYHPHHNNEGALSLENWKEIILQYKALIQKMRYRPWLILCGGEPLASPYLLPLLSFIKQELPLASMSILTNGTLAKEPLLSKLEAFPNLQFQVSLDGPDAYRHDQIRGQGNFEKALSGIRALKFKGFEVNVLSVLSSKTNQWMEDFFRLAKVEGFRSMNFVRFVPEGYGRKLLDAHEDQPLLGANLKLAYQNILTFMAKYEVASKTQSPLFDLLVPGLGRSGRYWESIVVDYQGYIVASSRSKVRLGHAIHEGLEQIFLHHPIYQGLRSGKVEVCGKCPLYNVCGGDRNAAFAASGDFLGPDPGCWRLETNQNLKGVI